MCSFTRLCLRGLFLCLVTIGALVPRVHGRGAGAAFRGNTNSWQSLPAFSRKSRTPSISGSTTRRTLELRGGSSYNYGDESEYHRPRNPRDSYEYDNRYESADRYDYNDRNRDYYGEQAGDYNEADQRYYDDYDDRGKRSRTSSHRGDSNMASSFVSSMPDVIRKGDRRIGFMLLTTGGGVTLLGMSLFFNKTLLKIGNLLVVAGVPMTIGPGRAAGYFLQPQKARATACLGIGMLLVLNGHPLIGIILEVFGLLNLFGNLFPIVLAMAKQLPVVGPLLKSSGRSSKGRRDDKPRRNEYEDDSYYYDGNDQSGRDSRERYY